MAVALAVLSMLKMGNEEEENRRKKGTVRKRGKDVKVLCLSRFTPVFCQGFNLTLSYSPSLSVCPLLTSTRTYTHTHFLSRLI